MIFEQMRSGCIGICIWVVKAGKVLHSMLGPAFWLASIHDIMNLRSIAAS